MTKQEMYAAGLYWFRAPPVYSGNWDDAAWIAWIDSSGGWQTDHAKQLTTLRGVWLGKIVAVPSGSGLGKVVEVFPHGSENLCHVHYIDTNTGKLMECPDKPRCEHKHTCPIHGANVRPQTLAPMTYRDIEYYVAEKMIDPSILS